MTDDQPDADIEIELPGEDPEPPEYEKVADFGERLRERFAEYHWEFGMLAGADGETVEIPAVHSCIESAFRIHVAGTLAEAEFPQQVYDDPDVDADFLATDQELGLEDIAVTVTATRRDEGPDRTPERRADGVHEHWHVNLAYGLSDSVVTSERVSDPTITIDEL
ncbi:hypothetical protein [Halosimplex halophilum]|uniref:hypothetical protein n=1 Tax=Halosimplex halophilum TaxID=2559572 RepID=UPI00107F7159|nr:hypothetical protein [Halosimplex halophilum]